MERLTVFDYSRMRAAMGRSGTNITPRTATGCATSSVSDVSTA